MQINASLTVLLFFLHFFRLLFNSHSRYDYLFNFLFYIGVWLINNVMIVSRVQQSDSVIHIHVAHLLQILFPFGLLHNIEHGQRSLAGYGPWGHKSRT